MGRGQEQIMRMFPRKSWLVCVCFLNLKNANDDTPFQTGMKKKTVLK